MALLSQTYLENLITCPHSCPHQRCAANLCRITDFQVFPLYWISPIGFVRCKCRRRSARLACRGRTSLPAAPPHSATTGPHRAVCATAETWPAGGGRDDIARVGTSLISQPFQRFVTSGDQHLEAAAHDRRFLAQPFATFRRRQPPAERASTHNKKIKTQRLRRACALAGARSSMRLDQIPRPKDLV